MGLGYWRPHRRLDYYHRYRGLVTHGPAIALYLAIPIVKLSVMSHPDNPLGVDGSLGYFMPYFVVWFVSAFFAWRGARKRQT